MATTIVTKKGSGAPAASDLVEGELAVDTTNGRLYTENSSAAVVELGSNPSGNITFGDNGKAIFGAGSDLQIYHDGNHSYIEDAGTGSIKIKVGDFRVENASGNNLIKGVGDVATLHHAGSEKLATTSTGIDVTGTVTADGLTSAGDVAITGGSSGSTVLTLTTNALADTPLMLFQRTGGAIAGKLAYEDGNTAMSFGTTTAHELKFLTSNTERMQITSAGNVLVGTTDSFPGFNDTNVGTSITSTGRLFASASGEFSQFNRNSSDGDILQFRKDGSSVGSIGAVSGDIVVGTGDTGLRFYDAGRAIQPRHTDGTAANDVIDLGMSANRFKDLYLSGSITSGANGGLIKEIGGDTSIVQGAVGIRINDAASALSPTTASANNDASVDLGVSNIRFKDLYLSGKVITGGNTTSNVGTISFVADSERCVITGGYDTGGGGILKFFTDTTGGTSVQRMSINNAGTVTIVGALSKGSGSFKIDHPLPEKTETHHLVHSFVESPQADNIYRGKVDLVDGSVTVNIDTVSGMTEGTFVLLNTNTQCFTSNESGWTAVKGSVSGNILTITAQESCSDTISWLVIGERHDQHMLDTDWTDENGKVIVEPLKES